MLTKFVQIMIQNYIKIALVASLVDWLLRTFVVFGLATPNDADFIAELQMD